MRAVVTRHVHSPFEWGVSDCSFVFDAIEAMTGFDALEGLRGYRSEAEALDTLNAAGFLSVRELIEETFVEIPVGLAGRGDIAYPARIPHPLMSPAILDGASAFSKHPAGGIIMPRTGLARAWAV